MAENEDGQEKTERATGKRQRDARERGQVPRSRELNTTVMLLASAGGLLAFGSSAGTQMIHLMQTGLTLDRQSAFDTTRMLSIVGDTLWDAFIIIAPLLIIATLAALATPLLMGGWNVSMKALAPDISKIDPLKGMKKLASPQGFMELVKSIIKASLIGGFATLMIWHSFSELMSLGNLDVRSAIVQSFGILGWIFLKLSATLILIAIVDVPFQLWNHNRQLRMTKKEVKEEGKETEGNPENKARVRRVQQEISMRRMMADVPKADVIVTNPTHFAVALRYDDEAMGAPRVVAKGADLVAMQIRTIARENRVPVFEAPPLARALYYNAEIGSEIPAGLYLAVAQVLAYVYQLKHSIYGDAERPKAPNEFDIPDEFLQRH